MYNTKKGTLVQHKTNIRDGKECFKHLADVIGELQRIQRKRRDERNVEDKVFLQVIAETIKRGVYKQEQANLKTSRQSQQFEPTRKSPNYHYAFIVPTQWQNSTKEEILRPMFIRAGLISENDYTDRLLFLSTLECDLEAIQLIKSHYLSNGQAFNIRRDFKRGAQYMICKFVGREDLSLHCASFELGQSPTFAFNGGAAALATNNVLDTGAPFNLKIAERLKSGLFELLKSKECCCGTTDPSLLSIVLEDIIRIIVTYFKDQDRVKT